MKQLELKFGGYRIPDFETWFAENSRERRADGQPIYSKDHSSFLIRKFSNAYSVGHMETIKECEHPYIKDLIKSLNSTNFNQIK